MALHTHVSVFNLERTVTLGWPETFALNGTPDDDMVCRKFWFKTPCQGAFKLHRLSTTRHERVEFSLLDFPFHDLAILPGSPFDPHILPEPCAVNGLRLGPTQRILDVSDVRMRIEYTGKVPPSMKPGAPFKLVVLFIGIPVT